MSFFSQQEPEMFVSILRRAVALRDVDVCDLKSLLRFAQDLHHSHSLYTDEHFMAVSQFGQWMDLCLYQLASTGRAPLPDLLSLLKNLAVMEILPYGRPHALGYIQNECFASLEAGRRDVQALAAIMEATPQDVEFFSKVATFFRTSPHLVREMLPVSSMISVASSLAHCNVEVSLWYA